MDENAGFVNREDEIAEIERLIGEWGSLKILCVGGEGGVGKSRLLERIRELYPVDRQRRARVLVTERIDFDEPGLRVSETLGRRIARELGEEHFDLYIEALLDWRRMEIGGVSATRLTEEGEKVDLAFLRCFHKVADSRRIVLLLDTIEQIRGTDVWTYHLKLASQLPNTLIILAGREVNQVQEDFAAQANGKTVQLIQLEPLKVESSEEYLQYKQEKLHIALDPDLAKRILILAGGRPLLIDLAIDWVARGIPLPWLLQKNLDELSALSPELQAEFEKALVSPIGDIHTPRNRLLWMMALVWPLDKEMATRLTHWSAEQVAKIWQDISVLSFVRKLPDDSLMLHDVVREMVLKHLRPEVEPERENRWFSDVLSYLDELQGELQTRLKELVVKEQHAREAGDNRTAWDLFVEQESTERALWTIEGQYLGYFMLLDPEQGIAKFEEAWQRTTTSYRLSYRSVLISQVQRFRDRLSLSPAQVYQIDLRRAQYFLDNAMYEESEKLLSIMLEKFRNDPQCQAELSIQLGNVVIRLGRFEEGRSYFTRAMQASQRHDLSKWLVQALNALGWVCRLMGKLEEAGSHYRKALRLSLHLGDVWRQAWLMNNLGYVYALQHNRDTALRLCNQALNLWKKIGFDRGIGAVYSTLGEISLEFNQLEDAVSYFDQALNIFESARDSEWLSTAYCGQGATYWLIGELDKAQEKLEKAQEIGLKRDRPIILHRLAHVHLQRKNIQIARELFEQSYQASRSAPDPFYELNSLGDLAKIAVLEGQVGKRDEFVEGFADFQRRHKGVRYRLPEGLLLRYLGDLHLLAQKFDTAVDFYKKAWPLIAVAGSYEPYTITGQLADMETTILPQIASQTVVDLGQHLEDLWVSEGYEERYPEALPFFARWRTWTGSERGNVQ